MRNEEIDPEELSDALFWAELQGVKDVEFRTVREWVESDGYEIAPHPSDDDLPRALETILDRLAACNIVVESTDHLSDRELYDFLIHPEQLDVHMALLPSCFMHIDVIGGFSEEDLAIYLRHYASEEDRASWKEHFPEYQLPDRESLPYDRDRFLPKAHLTRHQG
jgi:hypothetical protein